MSISIADRLKSLAGSMNGVILASFCNVSIGSISKYLKGGTPDVENAIKIARAFNVTLDWLLTGQGPKTWNKSHLQPKALPQPQPEPEPIRQLVPSICDKLLDDYVFIPGYSMVSAAAGGGTYNDNEVADEQYAFRREWAVSDAGIDPERAAIIRVDGDSMEPTLSRGDVILIDRRHTTFSRDAIYVFQWEEGLFVKRIQRANNSCFDVISDNTVYDKKTLTPVDLENLRVIGRVMWVGRRM
ncbi:MAG: helix-turn-helix transcriptional regulator [Magnetococcales bacterium]|nr:helix-turn-helix transcriptional regulator [Magnetococcales bacterium]MBF0115509.1 helix-turn-helix transcriptional regulator [Magnetococcales bacterium]